MKKIGLLKSVRAWVSMSPPALDGSVCLASLSGLLSLQSPISEVGTIGIRRIVVKIRFSGKPKPPDTGGSQLMSVIVLSGWGSLISLIIFLFRALTRKFTLAWGEAKSG